MSIQAIEHNGKHYGWMALASDITERRKMEEELKRSNEINFNLIDTPIVRVNKALERLIGYSASEIVGLKPPFPWWTEQDRKLINERYFNAALAKRGQSFEEKFIKRYEDRVLHPGTYFAADSVKILVEILKDVQDRQEIRKSLYLLIIFQQIFFQGSLSLF